MANRILARDGHDFNDSDPRAVAYRSGIRRALAEVTILRVEAERRLTDTRARANVDRRAQVRAYTVAANRLNALMLEPCPMPPRLSGAEVQHG